MASQELDVQRLFEQVKKDWPQELGEETWYLAVTAVLTCIRHAELLSPLYAYLVKTQYTNPPQKSRLSDRLKDSLIKLGQIAGTPRLLSPLTHLATAEATADTPPSDFHYTNLQFTDETRDRGVKLVARMLSGVSTEDFKPLTSNIGQHKADLDWLGVNLSYGLIWSDNRVLDPVETEIVVLTGIVCEGVGLAQTFHFRGIMGLGVSRGVLAKMLDVVRGLIKDIGRSEGEQVRLEDVLDVRGDGNRVPWE